MNVEITDLLPAGVACQAHSTMHGTYNNVSDLWSVGSLADGASATLTVTAQVTGTGTTTNTASITALDQTDPNTGDNHAAAEFFPLEGHRRGWGVPVFPSIYVGLAGALWE